MYVVDASSLIRVFQRMYDEHWEYKWGKSEKGCVDCSGAFAYAFRLFGIKYPNGSNAIARGYTCGGMLPITKAKPGMAAFKARSPGEKGYDLPDKYMPGGASYNGDLDDYYHIGLVDETGKYVLNAKGTNYGFCRDALTAKNGWDYVAYLVDVEYQEKEPGKVEDSKPVTKALVVLPVGASGRTVNLRGKPSKDGDIIARIPVGSEVNVLCDMGEWCEIQHSPENGYMMSNYLEYAGQYGESGDALTQDQRQEIENALRKIENFTQSIVNQIDVIGGIVGRG